MKEKVKAPELRFPGFTDDWEERKLKDVVEKQIKGKAQFEKLAPGDVEYLDTSRLNGGQAILTNGLKDVMLDDVLILWDGSKAGTVYHGFEGSLGSTLKAYRTSADSKFVYQYLKRYQDNIYNNYRTPNIPHVQKDFLDVFTISVPRSDEQAKIGSFFKQLDDTIALHQHKLDLLKEQKKGYLQKMFPKNGEKVPELRFAGVADDWEQRKLGEMLVNLEAGVSVNSSDYDTGYFILKTSAIKMGNIDLLEVKSIVSEEVARAKTPLIKNSIIISRMNTPELVGASGLVRESIDNIFLPDRLWQGQVAGNFSPEWLIQSINIAANIKKIRDLATGTSGSMKNISKKSMLDLIINVPTLEEQQKIGSFFKQLDDVIALHQRKLDLLKEQKKGYLQKMFV